MHRSQDLLAHFRLHLSKSELVNCPFAKCGKIFKARSATCSVDLVSTASDVMESGTAENVPESVDMPDDIDLRALYTKNLCMFYMKLQAKYHIPSSTIQMIVEEINDLHAICSQHTKKQFKEVLKARTNLSDSDVDEALSSLTDLHSSCSTTISTEYTRK